MTVLVENHSKSPNLTGEHGLSLHIKTENQNILFDTGASSLFLKNAEKLGIDIKSVDKVVISHGHYDHGGGIASFLKINKKAKILLNKSSFGLFYSVNEGKEKYIGLDQSLISNERLVFIEGSEKLDDELEIFSSVKQKVISSHCNSSLYIKDKTEFKFDDFRHEQNLVIKDNDNYLLLSGCAHNGIINILEHYVNKHGSFPTHVVGGFHLYNTSQHKSEAPEIVNKVAKYLFETSSKFYTGHCTGEVAYNILKKAVGRKLYKISTGCRIEIV